MTIITLKNKIYYFWAMKTLKLELNMINTIKINTKSGQNSELMHF